MSRLALAFVVLTALAAAPARAAEPVYLEQGWTADDRAAYYALPQGSELMPYRWFLALEQPWSDTLFRENEYIESFRYLPAAVNKFSPEGLAGRLHERSRQRRP